MSSERRLLLGAELPEGGAKLSTENPLLELKHISKTYPDGWKLDDVNLKVHRREIVSILGPSGCGKSTLLRLIAGLERLDSGQVLLDGTDVTHVPPHLRGFGLMFQEYALFPHKNVLGNVAFGLRMHGYRGERLRKRVTEVLELVGLSAFEERDVNSLSGGERQRVALARSLAPEPALLMLDEPLGALDRAMRERLMSELPGILHRAGTTAITVTHDQIESFAIADRLMLLRDGCVIQIGTPEEVYYTPASVWVAGFLGLQNVIDVSELGRGWVETPLGRLTFNTSNPVSVYSSAEVKALIRPDAARLVEPQKTELSDQGAEINILRVLVKDRSFRGETCQVRVMHDSGVTLTFSFSGDCSLPQVGEVADLRLASGSVILVKAGEGVCRTQTKPL